MKILTAISIKRLNSIISINRLPQIALIKNNILYGKKYAVFASYKKSLILILYEKVQSVFDSKKKYFSKKYSYNLNTTLAPQDAYLSWSHTKCLNREVIHRTLSFITRISEGYLNPRNRVLR